MFLDYSTIEPNTDIEPICFRVLFPPDSEYASSHAMLRDEALLPPEPWYQAAIVWIRQALNSTPASTSMDAMTELLQRDCGNPPFWLDAMSPAAMVPSINQFVDMCEWLAMKVRFETKTPYYDLTTIEIIGKHNIPLFRENRAVWRRLVTLFSRADDPHLLSAHPMLAAFEAVSAYLDELNAKNAESKDEPGNIQS